MLAQLHFFRAMPTAAVLPIPEAELASVFNRDLIGLHEFIDRVEGAGFAHDLKGERGRKEGERGMSDESPYE